MKFCLQDSTGTVHEVISPESNDTILAAFNEDNNGVHADTIEDVVVAMTDGLKNFKELSNLSLEIDGAKRYFNPAHIISFWVEV